MSDPEALDDEDFYSDMLGNLLAIIHSDGGHYRLRYGTIKATDDAMKIVTDLRVKLDAYKTSADEGWQHAINELAEANRLRLALQEYGQHKPYCGATKPDDHIYHPCTCGLDQALKGPAKP